MLFSHHFAIHIMCHRDHCVKTWRHLQNWIYAAYRNAAKPHSTCRENLLRFERVVTQDVCRQTDRHTNMLPSSLYSAGVKSTSCLLLQCRLSIYSTQVVQFVLRRWERVLSSGRPRCSLSSDVSCGPISPASTHHRISFHTVDSHLPPSATTLCICR